MKQQPNQRKRPLVAKQMPGGPEPAPFKTADAIAIQALAAGKANDGQQKRALEWILHGACQLPVWAYRSDQRETDIALGRQHVGQQIMGLVKINVSALRKREQEETSEHG